MYIKKVTMKKTYKNVSMATANAIRASLLESNTTEALNYTILHSQIGYYSIEEISEIASMIPITGHGVLLLDKSGEVSTKDFKTLGKAIIKDEQNLLKKIDASHYKCLVWFNEDGEYMFEDLLGNLKENYNLEEYLESNPMTGIVIYKDKEEEAKVREHNLVIHKHMKLFNLSPEEKIRAVFVTEEGGSINHSKYSAVTSASCYMDKDRTVSIEFDTVTGKDHDRVFKKAINELINKLKEL